jgi:membrane protein implicated in regulation of membrane protease activity
MIAVVPLQGGLLGPEALPLLLIVAGLVLSIAEAMAPGAHFIVLGIALLGAGLAGLLLGPLASPFVLGFLVLIFGALALYGYHELSPMDSGESSTPISSDTLKGKSGTVTERVTTTDGQVRLEGGGFNPNYAARSMDEDIPEGTEVVVVDPGGGNVVTVTALENDVDEIDRELDRGREQIEAERLEQQRLQQENDVETESTSDSDATDAD